MQGSSSDMPCRILGNFFCFFCVLIDILLFLQMIVLKNIFFQNVEKQHQFMLSACLLKFYQQKKCTLSF
jgi:hypothetical protein